MKKIGIIVAMEEEEEAILNIMKEKEVIQEYNLKFIKGKIKNTKCVVVQSGVGKVNAARTTQIMIDKFDIQYVINVGAGGAINEKLNIGDIVIGRYVLQHDFDITAFGHDKGYITGVGNKVICDEKLVQKFDEIIKNLSKENYSIKIGIIATGDIFCTDPKMKDKIHDKFDADVVDMECAAIAQTCFLDNLPFAVVRSISDTPNKENAATFDENLKLASKRCAEILDKFLEG